MNLDCSKATLAPTAANTKSKEENIDMDEPSAVPPRTQTISYMLHCTMSITAGSSPAQPFMQTFVPVAQVILPGSSWGRSRPRAAAVILRDEPGCATP
jgi:hypothetical protein